MLISLGLLATMALTVFALFLQLVRGAEKQENLSAGTVLAEEVLTERLQTIFDDAEPGLSKAQFFANNSPPESPLEGTVSLGTQVFTYRIHHRTLLDGAGVPVGGAASNRNRLKRLDVTVWWWTPEPGQSRPGSGVLSTTFTRFVNEKTEFRV